MNEFLHIAYCSVVYKCISKHLCSRLKGVLGCLIDEAQSAFIKGRHIVHNVMLVQELMSNYKKNGVSSRCVMKIYLRKAYDFVSWSFVEEILRALKFPDCFVMWIMSYITNTKYSLSINGGIHSFFNGKKGLQQGDPLPPLIFVVCTEYLSRIMKYVNHMPSFKHTTPDVLVWRLPIYVL